MKKLNEEFDVVKKALAAYLDKEQKRFKKMEAMALFFERIKSFDTVFLNFNYTDTVKRYLGDEGCKNLIHIHGELNGDANPIVFGYAADDIECAALMQKGNDFLKNIKKIRYNGAISNKRLLHELNSKGNRDIAVYILGHSCGLSDKLILNQVLNNEKVSSIVVSYFKDLDRYTESVSSIYRIMNNPINYKRVASFPDCFRMPQHDDSRVEVDDFRKKINSFMDYKTRQNKSEGQRWAIK